MLAGTSPSLLEQASLDRQHEGSTTARHSTAATLHHPDLDPAADAAQADGGTQSHDQPDASPAVPQLVLSVAQRAKGKSTVCCTAMLAGSPPKTNAGKSAIPPKRVEIAVSTWQDCC